MFVSHFIESSGYHVYHQLQHKKFCLQKYCSVLYGCQKEQRFYPYSINCLTDPDPLILFTYHSGMSHTIDFGPGIEFLSFSQQLNHYDDRYEPKLNSLDNFQCRFTASDVIKIYLMVAEMRHTIQLETSTWPERLSHPCLRTHTDNRIQTTITIFFKLAQQPPVGQGPPHSQDFQNTLNDAPESVGPHWTNNQHVAETSTQRDSNPQSQQASGRRLTPQTKRPLGPAH